MPTRVTVVRVRLDIITTLGKVQLGLWNDLVEGKRSSSKDLAGVAMAREESEGNLGISGREAKDYTRECAFVGPA